MTLEELDEREQTERPSHAVAVAQPVERVGRRVQPFVGQREVARQERQPRAVLLDVGQATLVGELQVLGLGFTEEPLGIDQRPAEHLDEAALAQRIGEQLGGGGGAQQFDTDAQLEAGVGLVAGEVVQHPEQPSSGPLGLDVVVFDRLGEHRVDVGARLGELALFDAVPSSA